jgi:hypothetical protein
MSAAEPAADQVWTEYTLPSPDMQVVRIPANSLRSRELGSVADACIRATSMPERAETAVTSGHRGAIRTACGLSAHRLTPCAKRPSKQRVTCASSPALRCRVEPYFDLGNARPSGTDLARLQVGDPRRSTSAGLHKGGRWRSRSSVR